MKKLFLILFTAVAFLGLSSCSKLGSDGLVNTSWLYEYEDDPAYRKEFYDMFGVYPSTILNFKEKTMSWTALGMSLFETNYEYKSPTVTIYIPEILGSIGGFDEKTLIGTVKGNEMVIKNLDGDYKTFHKK